MKLVITECDHDAFAPEEAVAAEFGAELVFAQARTTAELIEAAHGADGLIVQYATISAEVLDALPTVRAIGRYGVGVDTLDVAAATARGIAVCNVPDYGTEAVSDHAIALALAQLRDIPRLDRLSRAGRSGFPAIRPEFLFAGRTFGILGAGRIGSATARKASALGFEVIVADVLAEVPEEFGGYPSVSLSELLARADVLSVHTPLTPETRHLIGRDTLALVKPGVVLVNTSRGPVVDSEALAEALADGRVRAAGLDVLETEPIPLDHPLLAFDTVCFTPHTAWYSEETYVELKRRTVENVAMVLAGRRPRNILNPEVLATT